MGADYWVDTLRAAPKTREVLMTSARTDRFDLRILLEATLRESTAQLEGVMFATLDYSPALPNMEWGCRERVASDFLRTLKAAASVSLNRPGFAGDSIS